ncbi:hypothetical protein ACLM5H_00120 [Fredinandcohnia humi]
MLKNNQKTNRKENEDMKMRRLVKTLQLLGINAALCKRPSILKQ